MTTSQSPAGASRRLVAWTMAVLPGLALAACAPQAGRGMTLVPGKLRIGTYFVNPPFEYVADGQRIGFEVDLMNDIARRLSLERFPI